MVMASANAARPWRPQRAKDYGDERLKALLDEMQEIIALVRREGPTLWRRALERVQPGFPPESGGGQVGAGGSTDVLGAIVGSRVDAHAFVGTGTRDAEGRELCECGQPYGAQDHRTKVDHDPVREYWFGCWDNLQLARDVLIEAQRSVVDSLRPRDGDDDLDVNICCQSHLRIGVKVPQWKRGLCWWCDRQSRLLGPGPDGDRRLVQIEVLRAYEDRRAEREERKSSA